MYTNSLLLFLLFSLKTGRAMKWPCFVEKRNIPKSNCVTMMLYFNNSEEAGENPYSC